MEERARQGRMRKLPLIIVEWEDTTGQSSWEEEKNADFKIKPSFSVGWKLKTDRKYVLITRQREVGGNFADRLKIPRGCIKSIKRLE